MAEGEVKGVEVETTNAPEENVAKQQTGLTDLSPGATATITNPDPVLSDQGQDVLAAMKSEPAQQVWPGRNVNMTPQAKATLKALRGH